MGNFSTLIADKNFVWFENSNQYVQMEEPAFEVFKLLEKKTAIEDIAKICSKQYDLDLDTSLHFVNEVHSFIKNHNTTTVKTKPLVGDVHYLSASSNQRFIFRYYAFVGQQFCFKYGNQTIEQMIHPMLAHLECPHCASYQHEFELREHDEHIGLQVNTLLIGTWTLKETHLFKGKVFFEMMNKAYQKSEDDWMALLHGSAISNGKECIIVAGDSGAGKSTTTALLLANGFHFLSDDFVAVSANDSKVYAFPTAISIKRGAVNKLSTAFPEILNAKEYYYPELNKHVRYLAPKHAAKADVQKMPVKAIIYVHFNANATFHFGALNNASALQKLIPDSWISPRHENAKRFLNWGAEMQFYNLNYATDDQMISTIKNFFNNE